jgi:hypothetical protein
LEARGGIEPPIKVLQTFALPLGDRALDCTAEEKLARRELVSTWFPPAPELAYMLLRPKKQKTHLPDQPVVGRYFGNSIELVASLYASPHQ